jgi:hypothetical protein
MYGKAGKFGVTGEHRPQSPLKRLFHIVLFSGMYRDFWPLKHFLEKHI